ncbi:hypothetical protein CROQUDRAFT_657071 [Cronartium quercuum f. sp. fusiforme G11]|uniref:Uncharacterized protein n=1 Tax=Cronartium quercuum f. sp. fusiforme G11 TaxID=708437 RepID=A0A9P6NM88_9BASI|nr:hypothetical protein CROQUDRAFT_657071 [Cronartium quercuum f. sp. fusiforme G11]
MKITITILLASLAVVAQAHLNAQGSQPAPILKARTFGSPFASIFGDGHTKSNSHSESPTSDHSSSGGYTKSSPHIESPMDHPSHSADTFPVAIPKFLGSESPTSDHPSAGGYTKSSPHIESPMDHPSHSANAFPMAIPKFLGSESPTSDHPSSGDYTKSSSTAPDIKSLL